ncbi:conjugal transfer protein TraF [Campylobacter lari]|nr:conjugal transfer protein TraF [Campylobacter lari]
MFKKTFFVVLCCISHLNSSSFFDESKKGWFYYEKIESNKTNDINASEDELFIKSILLDSLESYSAEEFTRIFEKVRQIAVMNPTKDNVKTLQIMNKWQTDQSEKFAKVWALNLLEDPNLEYPEIGSDKFSRSAEFKARDEKINTFFKEHKNDLSFVVFQSGFNKDINEKQKLVYDSLIREYSANVEYIDTDKRPELIKKFNLTTTPESFFIYKNSKGEAIWQRVKAGLANREEIIKNTLFLFDNAILEKDK